jgi:hypothetical protein
MSSGNLTNLICVLLLRSRRRVTLILEKIVAKKDLTKAKVAAEAVFQVKKERQH